MGNNVSHSKRRTKREFKPNLFDKKFFLSEENRWVDLRVSAAGIRVINKKGLKKALEDAVVKLSLIHIFLVQYLLADNAV